ncbi:MAG: efflux RND transporter periplasmic adaptor subunit [Puia sp.]|nr:efflux RND transporter periplasmic adaptor subunit [Puia sp.]
MSRYKVLILLVLVLLLAGGAVWYFRFRKEEKPVVLQTETPRYDYISKSVSATGTIEPVDTVTVGTQVSGTIQHIYTDFNAVVKKGQLIAQLDKSLFLAAVNQYKANLDVAKATLVYQKSNFDRQTLLYNSGAISKADYETAQDQYLTAKSTVESVQAQLDAADKNLSYSSIYSPIDGVVLTRNISMGQTVAASFNTPTLFIIARDITRMQVQAAVGEADIGDVRVGQRVVFTVDAYPDISFTGTVNQIRLEPVVSSNVVTYTTIVSASNKDLKLKPGMTANIFIYTYEQDHALLISSKALQFRPDATVKKRFIVRPFPRDSSVEKGGLPGHSFPGTAGDTSSREINAAKKGSMAFVWVQSGDSLVERRLTTGINDDTHVQVLDGLTTGDVVVTGIGVSSAAGAANVPTSPFMPTRRASPAPSRPAAGGGGR